MTGVLLNIDDAYSRILAMKERLVLDKADDAALLTALYALTVTRYQYLMMDSMEGIANIKFWRA